MGKLSDKEQLARVHANAKKEAAMILREIAAMGVQCPLCAGDLIYQKHKPVIYFGEPVCYRCAEKEAETRKAFTKTILGSKF